MAEPRPAYIDWLDISHIVTEDDTPVDNLASEKQQRLLTEPLYSTWLGPGEGRPFLAAANVGVFPSIHSQPLVPDVFLSMDVEVPEDFWAKRNRSYFAWEFGKVPDVVIEIVSNREGGETTTKKAGYARMGVSHYAIYDPQLILQPEALRVYSREGSTYRRRADHQLPDVGLGLMMWEGVFERKRATWLRWCDAGGRMIETGAERAAEEAQRAAEEAQRAAEADQRAAEEAQRAAEADQRAAEEAQRAAEADQRAAEADRRAVEADRRAEEEKRRADALAARLRELGIDPQVS